MNKIIRRAAVLLALTVVMTLCGCGKVSVDEVMSVVAPTDAPELTAEDLGIGEKEEEIVIEPLRRECGTVDGILSPFWATAEGDLDIVKMTQLSLLAVEGRQSPSEISRSTNSDGSTTVTIQLRNNLCFSDGHPLTSDDLIFTYYALLDKNYDGPATLYQLPIRGLNEYWNGMESNMYAKYVALYDEIYNNGRYDEDLRNALEDVKRQLLVDGVEEEYLDTRREVIAAQKDLDEYDSEKAQQIQDTILRYWKEDTQALVDYCFINYSSSIEMKTGYTREEVAADPGLQVMFAMVDTGYAELDEVTGTLTAKLSGSTWDMKTSFPTAEDFYNELYSIYDGDVQQYFSIEGYGRNDIMEAVQNELVALWASQDEDWQGAVTSIAGIHRHDNRTILITLEYCDDATLRTLCDIYIAPLHFYGDETLYDYAGDSFGFTKGNLNALRENRRTSLGAGEYVYRETLGKTVFLDTNTSYWLGAAQVPGAELTIR